MLTRVFQKYLFRELVIPVTTSIFLVASVLLVARLVKITTLVINRGFTLWEVGQFLALLAPSFFELALPMGVLLGVLSTVGRMASQGEIMGAQTCGLGPSQLLAPVLLLATIASLLTATFSLHLRPISRATLSNFADEVARRRISAAIQEQVFFSQIPGLIIYADRVEQRGRVLSGVFLSEASSSGSQTTVIAQRGYLITPNGDGEAAILRLEDGTVFTWKRDPRNYEVSHFQALDWDLAAAQPRVQDSKQEGLADPKSLPTMRLVELLRSDQSTATAREFLLELNRRFATPVACVVFGAFALAWALAHSATPVTAIAVSTLSFVTYYLLDGIAESLMYGAQGLELAWFGAWLPCSFFVLVFLTLWSRILGLNTRAATHNFRSSRRNWKAFTRGVSSDGC